MGILGTKRQFFGMIFLLIASYCIVLLMGDRYQLDMPRGNFAVIMAVSINIIGHAIYSISKSRSTDDK